MLTTSAANRAGIKNQSAPGALSKKIQRLVMHEALDFCFYAGVRACRMKENEASR